MKNKKIPQRTCLGCREKKDKAALIRVVRKPDKTIVLDRTGKIPGRGAYICPDKACFNKAIKSKALNRALQADIQDDIIVDLSNQVLDDE